MEYTTQFLNFIISDFEMLKRKKHIKDFYIEQVKVKTTELELTLVDKSESQYRWYQITFSTWALFDINGYTKFDSENMKNISEEQESLRGRLRIQAALLKLYKEKSAHRKGDYGSYIIYVTIINGKFVWR